MFFLLQNWRRGSLALVGRGEGGKRNTNMTRCKQCVHMHVNAKMRPVETVPGIRGGGMGERSGGGGNSSMIYLIHCKNLCKCYDVLTPRTIFKNTTYIKVSYTFTLKKKKERKKEVS
jgi:hypothetical protein